MRTATAGHDGQDWQHEKRPLRQLRGGSGRSLTSEGTDSQRERRPRGPSHATGRCGSGRRAPRSPVQSVLLSFVPCSCRSGTRAPCASRRERSAVNPANPGHPVLLLPLSLRLFFMALVMWWLLIERITAWLARPARSRRPQCPVPVPGSGFVDSRFPISYSRRSPSRRDHG